MVRAHRASRPTRRPLRRADARPNSCAGEWTGALACAAEPPTALLTTRVARMDAVLDGQSKNAKICYWSWMSTYGAISFLETVANATGTGDAFTGGRA
jgi:hypothetical protein